MTVETSNAPITALKVKEENMDLINVYLIDLGKAEGRCIIECYGRVWAAYWNAMGDRNVAEFVSQCDRSYLEEKMSARSGYEGKVIAAAHKGVIQFVNKQ